MTLHVTVRDRSRHYVTGLEKDQFRVFEDGRRQELRFFQKSGLPLALTFLLDTSSSVELMLPRFQRAALEFVRELAPDDLASVITFGDTVRVAQYFTRDRSAIAAAIGAARPAGQTALYNGVYIALNELGKALPDPITHVPRRRTMLVFSDGDDNASGLGFQDVLDLAVQTDVAIYTIRPGRPSSSVQQPSESEFVLRRLAAATGARPFFPLHGYELHRVLADIRAELSSQYALTYEPDRQDRGRFRSLSVLVDRPGAVARTRPGYFARPR